MPDPGNKYLVCHDKGGVRVRNYHSLGARQTHDEALNLAAWLVATALDQSQNFDVSLKAFVATVKDIKGGQPS